MDNGTIWIGEVKEKNWDGKATKYTITGGIFNIISKPNDLMAQQGIATNSRTEAKITDPAEAWYGTGNKYNK